MSEITIKSITTHTVRNVVEERRLHLLACKGKWNWKQVKKHWNEYYKPKFGALAEDVYRRMKRRGVSSLHLVELKCELCDEYFDLDEPFVELVIDHGGWDNVTVTFHFRCMRENINSLDE